MTTVPAIAATRPLEAYRQRPADHWRPADACTVVIGTAVAALYKPVIEEVARAIASTPGVALIGPADLSADAVLRASVDVREGCGEGIRAVGVLRPGAWLPPG